MAEQAHAWQWHVPVRSEDVPEAGLHLDLAAPDEVRAGIAALGEVTAIPRLEAALDVVRQGASRLRVTGRVQATVEQTCVVTLEPVTNAVNEAIDVVFAPAAEVAPAADSHEFDDFDDFDDDLEHSGDDAPGGSAGTEVPEALAADGSADVGAIAVEFLLLGIDPFPRKPGAEFKRPAERGATVSPFAELAKLRGR